MAKLHARGRSEKYRLVKYIEQTTEFGKYNYWSVYACMSDGKILHKTIGISDAGRHSSTWTLVKTDATKA